MAVMPRRGVRERVRQRDGLDGRRHGDDYDECIGPGVRVRLVVRLLPRPSVRPCLVARVG